MICVKYIEFNIIVETALQIMRLPDIWKYENFDIVKQRNPTDNLFTSIILFCFNSTGKINTVWLTDRILVLFIFFTQLYLSHMFKRGRKPENQEKSF